MGSFNLKDEVAVITGAASGIGKAIALAYAQEGAKLALIDIDATGLVQVRKEINQKYVACRDFSVDITDRQGLEKIFEEILNYFGKVDILVNAAGIWKATPILKMSDEEMDRMLDVNFKGAYYCTRLVLLHMVERRKGKIICIASVAGKVGSGAAAHYAASKGAIVAFTKSLARELGPYGIRVNAIAPGLIDTPMGRATGEYGIEGYLKRTPLGRMGRPEEVAALAVFLGSAASDYVTGQVWNVCGGYLMD